MELAREKTIKTDRVVNAVVNELVVFDGVDCVGAGDGAGVGVGASAGIGAGVGAWQDQGATSCRRCCGFLCENCKKHDEDSIMYLQKFSKTLNEFKNKREDKGIQSKNVQHP